MVVNAPTGVGRPRVVLNMDQAKVGGKCYGRVQVSSCWPSRHSRVLTGVCYRIRKSISRVDPLGLHCRQPVTRRKYAVPGPNGRSPQFWSPQFN